MAKKPTSFEDPSLFSDDYLKTYGEVVIGRRSSKKGASYREVFEEYTLDLAETAANIKSLMEKRGGWAFKSFFDIGAADGSLLEKAFSIPGVNRAVGLEIGKYKPVNPSLVIYRSCASEIAGIGATSPSFDLIYNSCFQHMTSAKIIKAARSLRHLMRPGKSVFVDISFAYPHAFAARYSDKHRIVSENAKIPVGVRCLTAEQWRLMYRTCGLDFIGSTDNGEDAYILDPVKSEETWKRSSSPLLEWNQAVEGSGRFVALPVAEIKGSLKSENGDDYLDDVSAKSEGLINPAVVFDRATGSYMILKIVFANAKWLEGPTWQMAHLSAPAHSGALVSLVCAALGTIASNALGLRSARIGPFGLPVSEGLIHMTALDHGFHREKVSSSAAMYCR